MKHFHTTAAAKFDRKRSLQSTASPILSRPRYMLMCVLAVQPVIFLRYKQMKKHAAAVHGCLDQLKGIASTDVDCTCIRAGSAFGPQQGITAAEYMQNEHEDKVLKKKHIYCCSVACVRYCQYVMAAKHVHVEICSTDYTCDEHPQGPTGSCAHTAVGIEV